MPIPHIAVINSHPIQYFAPLYAYINQHSRLKLTALYLSDFSIRGDKDPGFDRNVKWDIDLLSGYDSVFIGRNARFRTPKGFFSLIAPEIWNAVRSGGFDAIWLHGHGFAANHIALAAAKFHSIPVLMRTETHLGLSRNPIKAILRKPVISSFYRLCDRFLAIGSANREFYRAMGIPSEKIFLTPYTVDNARFMAASEAARAGRKEFRKKLRIKDDVPIVLFASKFQPRKRPDDVIRAARVLADEGLQFNLIMVGSGEMETQLKSLVKDLRLTNVLFSGFVNQSSLPEFLTACDVFVLPSENEPWGLVVNEAMCAGLPIIVSKQVGCVRDLVKDGKTGFVFPAGNIIELTNALRRLISESSLRDQMSEESKKLISNWSYRECVAGLDAAITSLHI